MKDLSPFIIAGAVILGVGVGGYYFKDSLIKGQETVMNWADPEMNRYVGQKYFGGKKTKHRRNRKGNKSRRK